MSWTVQAGSQINGTDTEAILGLTTAISKDGTVFAYGVRSDPTNPNSTIDIKIRRRIGTTWQDFGINSTFPTEIQVTNFSQFTDFYINKFISLSDNGHTIAIGDYFVGTFDGELRVYTYDSGSDTWMQKGNSIGPLLANGYGISTFLSGDGSHMVASNIDSEFVIHGFDTGINDWVQILSTSTINFKGFNSGLAINYDGTVVAVGAPNDGGGTGVIYVYRKADPNDFSPTAYGTPEVIDNSTGTIGNLINNQDGLGTSIAMDTTGTYLIGGAPRSNTGFDNGAFKVYQFDGIGWIDYGNVFDGINPGDRLGNVVSMSSDGTVISVSSTQKQIGATPNAGDTTVYEYNPGTMMWDQVGMNFGIEETGALNMHSMLSGAGTKIVQGSVGANPGNTGTVRVLTRNPTIETYDNDYSVAFTASVTGNFITDLGLRGTDNHPNGLALSIAQIDATGSFVNYASLTDNFNGNGFDKVIAGFEGGPLYLNLNGSFLYENDGSGTTPSFQYTVTDTVTTSSAATVSFSLFIGPMSFVPDPVPTIVVYHTAFGGPNFILENDSGTITVSGGLPPYSPAITGGLGNTGALQVLQNGLEFDYQFTPNEIDTGGPLLDSFTVEISDSDAPQSIVFATISIEYFVEPELFLTPPPPPSITGEIGTPLTETNLTGTLSATGGTSGPILPVQYTYSIVGGVVSGNTDTKFGNRGTLVITNTSTGTYQYTPTSIPSTAGLYTDSFQVRATDTSGASSTQNFNVQYTLFGATQTFSLIPIMNQGLVAKTEGGTTITQTGLSGTLTVVPGSGTVATNGYGVVGGTDSGFNNSIVSTSNGLFTINKGTGSYTYQVTAPLGNEIDMYEDSFTLTARSTLGTVATTPYTVTFEIRPQMLLGTLTPSAGAIRRNTQISSNDTIGLSGTITPAVQYGVGELTYTIESGNPSGPFLISKSGNFSTLFVNMFTGDYEIDPDSLNISTTPGVYLDQYIIRVSDSNTPPNEQTLIYNVTATVDNTPIALLPIFRHSTTREIAGYWNFIIHDETGTQTITASGTVTVPNTEILVVGQTETQTGPVDLFRDTDTVIRQLLGSAAYDRTNPGDVLTQIKNNNLDVLDTDNIDGIQTRSFQLTRTSGGNIQTFVTELSDILSSQHSNFLLNRYRSNVGEAVMVIYANDAVSPLTNMSAMTILNQIGQLLTLGVRTIIAVMMAATLDPNNTAEKQSLEAAQQTFLNEVTNLIGNLSVNVSSVIVRYDTTSGRFLNVAGLGERPSTGPDILFNVSGFTSRNLYGALTDIAIIPPDTSKPLRIVITSVDSVNRIAIGEIIYGTLTSSSSANFKCSRTFTDNTNDVMAAGGTTVEFLDFEVAAGQVPEVEIRQGTTGKNVSELRPGDILYVPTFNYRKPTEARILFSVVSGFRTADITANDLFLQIDDGVRFPNNPVFRARAKATNPILRKYDSNDLSLVTISDNSIEFGFDYEIDVTLSASFNGAGLEEYIDFPRLGFVTFYFASGDNNQPIYNAYGRGAVRSIIRS